jgi:predicted PurR-regulated permease PerM
MADTATLTRRIIVRLLLGGLVILSFTVLRMFLVPVAWAAILAYATWPPYQWLRRILRGSATASALVMTFFLTAAVVLPMLWLVAMARTEMANAYAGLADYLERGPHPLPDLISRIPLLGEHIQSLLNRLYEDPSAARMQVARWIGQSTDDILNILDGVGRNLTKFGLALITVFFLYRDGERLLCQVRQVLNRFLGSRIDAYMAAAGNTTKAVVWGIVATALAQGVVAGVGYWWAGLAAPLLLGAITAVVALLPFGAPFTWGPIGLWLILSGQTAAGIGLLLWGTLVVSWIDNLVRPLVISGATHIPFPLILFGVLGGLAAFGMVGLFVGPVVLAILMAVWREWLGEAGVRESAQPRSMRNAR